MVKFKISVISDGIFVLFSSFLLGFATAFYLLKNNTVAITVALPFSVVVFCCFMLIHNKKKGKLTVKREDESNFIKCTSALCLAKDKDATMTVFKTLEKLGKKPFLSQNGIICKDDFYYVKFSYDLVTVGGIINAYKLTPKSKNLVYVGVDFTDDAKAFAKGFVSKIKLVPLSELFTLLKQTKTIPDGGFIPNEKKPTLLALLKATFSKGKSKTFALYGGFLLIMSRFVFFPVWYIIMGSAFLIYAITIKFFAPSPTETSFLK